MGVGVWGGVGVGKGGGVGWGKGSGVERVRETRRVERLESADTVMRVDFDFELVAKCEVGVGTDCSRSSTFPSPTDTPLPTPPTRTHARTHIHTHTHSPPPLNLLEYDCCRTHTRLRPPTPTLRPLGVASALSALTVVYFTSLHFLTVLGRNVPTTTAWSLS